MPLGGRLTNWVGCCGGGWDGCWSEGELPSASACCSTLRPRSGLPGFLGTSGPAFVDLGGAAKKKKRSGSRVVNTDTVPWYLLVLRLGTLEKVRSASSA